MLKLEEDSCPECNSKAISIQKNSGFKNLYKCEKCNCLMQLVSPRELSKRAAICIVASVVFLLVSAYLYSKFLYSVIFLSLSVLAPITVIIFCIKSLYANRSFKKVVKP